MSADDFDPNHVLRHYKGGQYVALSVGKHTETMEDMFVYESLSFGGIYVRPLPMVFETIMWPDGVERSRFFPEAQLPTSTLTQMDALLDVMRAGKEPSDSNWLDQPSWADQFQVKK